MWGTCLREPMCSGRRRSPRDTRWLRSGTVSVSGGEVVNVDVPLEEYAVLTVSKTGLTFDDSLRTYVVPLTGEYGIYTMEDGELRPYPSADSQMTVWSNVAQDDPQRKAA